MKFQLNSNYKPAGDQISAIQQLTNGINDGEKFQTLLGVTGSGKTFTVANVIEQVQKPTLIISHNKTLAAQLYQEFKQFFPNNKVEYYISHFDFYRPESYNTKTSTYLEKESVINSEIEQMRLSTVSSLMSGRKDVIVVSSVSCIFGAGNPHSFHDGTIKINVGQTIKRNELLQRLSSSLYSRNETLERGKFIVKGDVITVWVAYANLCVRISFFDDEIEKIETVDCDTLKRIESVEEFFIYPANLYVPPAGGIEEILTRIKNDLDEQIKWFNSNNLFDEAKRIKERVEYDIEMIREVGYVSGIENYSLYFDQRNPGDRPFCVFDYFPDDFLVVVDESHVTIPQLRGMYNGSRANKINLVDNGFRLPSAFDSRPLSFNEVESILPQTIFVSATPVDYEIQKSDGIVVEQLIRPTGLLDPIIEIIPSKNQIDHFLDKIQPVLNRKEQIIVNTLTKKMAEHLDEYLRRLKYSTVYIHSDIDSLDRIKILNSFQNREFDILIGVNLLREGLDFPNVSLVAVFDADKEGFLRDYKALTQLVGRSARNSNGKAILYADTITRSIQSTVDECDRRRKKQQEHNTQYNITPTTIFKEFNRKSDESLIDLDVNLDNNTLKLKIKQLTKLMHEAAKKQEFLDAARYRDMIFKLEGKI